VMTPSISAGPSLFVRGCRGWPRFWRMHHSIRRGSLTVHVMSSLSVRWSSRRKSLPAGPTRVIWFRLKPRFETRRKWCE
jgi:hypothetical protein